MRLAVVVARTCTYGGDAGDLCRDLEECPYACHVLSVLGSVADRMDPAAAAALRVELQVGWPPG